MKKLYLSALFFAAVTIVSAQSIIYVNSAAIGSNTGSSWPDAFNDLNNALNIAQSGDQVWVAQGTYYPTTDTDRTKSFNQKSGVRLYGGFAGTENSLTQRNWELYPAILSGDIGVPNDSTDNTYCVLYLLNPDATMLTDGFIIEKGNANNINAPGALGKAGAAILVYVSENNTGAFNLRNTLIRKNTSLGYGGASIIAENPYTPSITVDINNCRFERNNTFSSGAGLFVSGCALVNKSVQVKNSHFAYNTAPNSYGGAAEIQSSNIEINNCIFERNIARSFGGALNINPFGNDSVKIKIVDSEFRENQARIGGGLYIRSFSKTKYVIVDSCLFEKNSCIGYAPPEDIKLGAAFDIEFINTEGTDVKILNTSLIDNDGGFSFGIYTIGSGKVFFQNNILQGDKRGSEIALEDSLLFSNNIIYQCSETPTLSPNFNNKKSIFSNNLLFNNELLPITNFQGGLITGNTFLNNKFSSYNCPSCYNQVDTPVVFTNNIFWNNTNLTNTPGITWNLPLFNVKARFDHNIFDFAATDSLPFAWQLGTGNLFEQDPMFRDAANGDLRLHPCSPAIDAGTPAWLADYHINQDLGRKNRIVGTAPDIGAYELQPFALTAAANVQPTCSGASTGSVALSLENGCLPYIYSWQNSTGTGTGIDNLAAGDYVFTITDQRGNSIVQPITIGTAVLPESTVFTIENASCGTCADGSIELDAAIPISSILWSTGDTSRSIAALIPGMYTCVLTDDSGCSAEYSFTVSFDIATTNIADKKIAIWPNPATDQLNWTIPAAENIGYIEILDVFGKVQQRSMDIRQGRIAVDGLINGIYTVRFYNDKGAAYKSAAFVISR